MPKGVKSNSTVPKEPRTLLLKDDEHNYGVVVKKLGGSRFTIRLNLTRREVIGRLCGKFKHGARKKNNWVDVGTYVLVGLRDFQDNIADIVHVYEQNEVRQLKKAGELIDEDSDLGGAGDNEEIGFNSDANETGFDFNTI